MGWRQLWSSAMAATRWSGSDMEFGPDLGPMGLSGLQFFKSCSCRCSVGVALLGYSSIMRMHGAAAPGMVVASIFSARGDRSDWGWLWRSLDLTCSPSSEWGRRGD
jgi:hypothetical protein